MRQTQSTIPSLKERCSLGYLLHLIYVNIFPAVQVGSPSIVSTGPCPCVIFQVWAFPHVVSTRYIPHDVSCTRDSTMGRRTVRKTRKVPSQGCEGVCPTVRFSSCHCANATPAGFSLGLGSHRGVQFEFIDQKPSDLQASLRDVFVCVVFRRHKFFPCTRWWNFRRAKRMSWRAISSPGTQQL